MTNFPFHPGAAGLFSYLPPRYVSHCSIFLFPVENMPGWFKMFYACCNENHMSYIKGDCAKAFSWIRLSLRFHAFAYMQWARACAVNCCAPASPSPPHAWEPDLGDVLKGPLKALCQTSATNVTGGLGCFPSLWWSSLPFCVLLSHPCQRWHFPAPKNTSDQPIHFLSSRPNSTSRYMKNLLRWHYVLPYERYLCP